MSISAGVSANPEPEMIEVYFEFYIFQKLAYQSE